MGMRLNGAGVCLRHEDIPGKGPHPGTKYTWVDRMEAPVAVQAIAAYERIKDVLSREGGNLGCLVRLHLYQRDKRFFPVFDRVRRHYEPSSPTPSTAVGMPRFDPTGEVRFNIDGIALRPGAAKLMGTRTVLGGSKAHIAAAHFSPVVGAGPYLFIAGQIPVDTSRPGAPLIRNYEDIPPEGRFLQVGRSHEDTRNGPIASQTWFTYDLIRKHLEGAGSSLAEVLNLTVYLQDMRDFPTFHRVHEHFFPLEAPALTVVEVGEVGHKGTLIEIEPTALRAGSKLKKEILAEIGVPKALMSVGVRAGDLLFLSGIVGDNEEGTAIANQQKMRTPQSAVALQGLSILWKLEAALGRAGADLDQVAHLTVFLKDIGDLVQLEAVFKRAFAKQRPAFTVSEVRMPSPDLDACVSITAIAWVGEHPPKEVKITEYLDH